MNTSVNYSGFIDMIRGPYDDIESDSFSEIKETFEDNYGLLQTYLSDLEEIDHSYDM